MTPRRPAGLLRFASLMRISVALYVLLVAAFLATAIVVGVAHH